jgi:hypothetical protein
MGMPAGGIAPPGIPPGGIAPAGMPPGGAIGTPPGKTAAFDGPAPGQVGKAGEADVGTPGQPCPRATPVPATSAATEAKNPFLIERSFRLSPVRRHRPVPPGGGGLALMH